MQYHMSIAGMAAALLLAGCATVEEQQQQRIAAVPEAARGYIVGTFEVQCKKVKDKCFTGFASEWIYYRSADRRWDAHLNSGVYAPFQETPDDYRFPERGVKGSHFCLPLLPDVYGFYAFSYNVSLATSVTYSFNKANEFNLPFTVKPGEITYVGTLKLTTEPGRHPFGFELTLPGMLLLSSVSEGGIDAVLQKCPQSVRTWPVRNASLQAMDAASALVRVAPAP